VASRKQCEDALTELGARLGRGKVQLPERTLSCTITDLDATYRGVLRDGQLTDVSVVEDGDQRPPAQVRITVTSDDLVDMVDGRLPFAEAFRNGRLKVQASLRDLLRLRSLA
jgi:hypothetical protein